MQEYGCGGSYRREDLKWVIKDQGIKQANKRRKDVLCMQDTCPGQNLHWTWPNLSYFLKTLPSLVPSSSLTSSLVLIKNALFCLTSWNRPFTTYLPIPPEALRHVHEWQSSSLYDLVELFQVSGTWFYLKFFFFFLTSFNKIRRLHGENCKLG